MYNWDVCLWELSAVPRAMESESSNWPKKACNIFHHLGVKINQHVLAKEVPDKKHISALKNNYLTSSVTDTKVN